MDKFSLGREAGSMFLSLAGGVVENPGKTAAGVVAAVVLYVALGGPMPF